MSVHKYTSEEKMDRKIKSIFLIHCVVVMRMKKMWDKYVDRANTLSNGR